MISIMLFNLLCMHIVYCARPFNDICVIFQLEIHGNKKKQKFRSFLGFIAMDLMCIGQKSYVPLWSSNLNQPNLFYLEKKSENTFKMIYFNLIIDQYNMGV